MIIAPAVGLSHDYTSFLIFRLAIGAIGASFVITQYHTSVMFAPNVVGTANAAAAGWGNLGGGVTQVVMPLLFTGFLSLGVGAWWGWRLAMLVSGAALLLTGIAYYFLTQDTPRWRFPETARTGTARFALRRRGRRIPRGLSRPARVGAGGLVWFFLRDGTDHRQRSGAVLCRFVSSIAQNRGVASSFGLMNLFARALGGIVSDRCNRRWGLRGRALLLAGTVAAEGAGLMLFSQMRWLPLAIATMMLAGLFVKMSNGANYSVVPFVNKRALGAVAGIVGAGGNFAAMLAGFLFKSSSISYAQAFMILGVLVALSSALAFLVRFSMEDERVARREMEARLAPDFAVAAATGD